MMISVRGSSRSSGVSGGRGSTAAARRSPAATANASFVVSTRGSRQNSRSGCERRGPTDARATKRSRAARRRSLAVRSQDRRSANVDAYSSRDRRDDRRRRRSARESRPCRARSWSRSAGRTRGSRRRACASTRSVSIDRGNVSSASAKRSKNSRALVVRRPTARSARSRSRSCVARAPSPRPSFPCGVSRDSDGA